MSFVKSRGLLRSDKPTEFEGNIRDLAQRESRVVRQVGGSDEKATNDLSSLLRRVSAESTGEIDRLIDGLKHLRQKLHDDGSRIQIEIVEYACLSDSVIQLIKIVSEGMTRVKKVPNSPSVIGEALNSVDESPEERVSTSHGA
jgi:hypothetical protein